MHEMEKCTIAKENSQAHVVNGKRGRLQSTEIIIKNGREALWANEVKYLIVTNDRGLTFSPHGRLCDQNRVLFGAGCIS